MTAPLRRGDRVTFTLPPEDFAWLARIAADGGEVGGA